MAVKRKSGGFGEVAAREKERKGDGGWFMMVCRWYGGGWGCKVGGCWWGVGAVR